MPENRREEFNPDGVRAIIGTRLGKNISQVVDSASISADLGADSLDAVEIIMELEEKYGIFIPDKDAKSLATVGQTIEYVRSRYTPK